MRYAFYLLVLAITFTSLQSCNLLSAAGISSQGQPIKKVKGKLTSTTANSAVNVDHSDWDKLLKKHVNKEGSVNYKGFKKDKVALDNYLEKLSGLAPNKNWSVQELLAYYINLYNAYTIDAIINNYPLKSIKEINGVWTNGNVPIGNKNLSLGGIENGVLRKMDEPRIHFAINCASISCPKLLDEAYTAGKINEQLDKATLTFINSDKNDLSPENPKLSSIFKFYTDDFKVAGKTDLIGYINQYATIKINPTTTVSFKEYDWGLNEQ